jgi:toluene monooxygenase system protein E
MSQRTYWHLARLGRRPSDYDIASSRLLYAPPRGFELEVPLSAWYRAHQTGSPFVANDWERFRDPRETTYTKYTELMKTREAFVDGVLAASDPSRLSAEWRATLDRVLPALRYPVHGLQMLAAYVGHMAPSGRIVIACAFQAADEVRRIQRLAYRTRELYDAGAGFGREPWQSEPMWQPMREAIERMLAIRDWGEAFVALALALKPRFDELFVAQLGELARKAGDDTFGNILFSLAEDCRWHSEWSAELLRVALEDRPENAQVIRGWLDRWNPLAQRATEPIFGPRTGAAEAAYNRAAAVLP